ncbi:type I restriction-modification enzyme R subunit C-terminal domain-containing protein [Acidaminococcus fermentans]
MLKLADFSRFGKPSRIAGYFGGRAGYEKAVQEMENELYEDGRVS